MSIQSRFFAVALELVVPAAMLCSGFGVLWLSDDLDRRGDRALRKACQEVSHLAPSQVRDGRVDAFWGGTSPVSTACWVKGADGRWRQVNDIFGPDVDLYPKGLLDAYSSLAWEAL